MRDFEIAYNYIKKNGSCNEYKVNHEVAGDFSAYHFLCIELGNFWTIEHYNQNGDIWSIFVCKDDFLTGWEMHDDNIPDRYKDFVKHILNKKTKIKVIKK